MELLPRILIIEDDTNFARVLGSHLRHSGFIVQSASSEAEWHSVLSQGTVDGVLAGVRHPDSTALRSCAEIVSLSQGAPVFMITSTDGDDLGTRAILTGLSGIFYQPVDFEHIIRTLRTHIPKRPVARCLVPGQPVAIKIISTEQLPSSRGVVTRIAESSFHVDLEGALNAEDMIEVRTPGDDAMYEFRSKVLGADEIGQYILAKPNLLRRKQRRQHPRASFVRPVQIQHMALSASAQSTAAPDEPVYAVTQSAATARTADVSLGGMAVVTSDAFHIGERVQVTWNESGVSDDSSANPLCATGIVVRCEPVETPGYGIQYRIGVQFQRPSPDLQRSIERYLSGSPAV